MAKWDEPNVWIRCLIVLPMIPLREAHIVQPIPHITSFDVRVGGCGDLIEGLSANSTRKIPITDPN